MSCGTHYRWLGSGRQDRSLGLFVATATNNQPSTTATIQQQSDQRADSRSSTAIRAVEAVTGSFVVAEASTPPIKKAGDVSCLHTTNPQFTERSRAASVPRAERQRDGRGRHGG